MPPPYIAVYDTLQSPVPPIGDATRDRQCRHATHLVTPSHSSPPRRSSVLSLRQGVADLRNTYTSLHDALVKNREKLSVKPGTTDGQFIMAY